MPRRWYAPQDATVEEDTSLEKYAVIHTEAGEDPPVHLALFDATVKMLSALGIKRYSHIVCRRT